MLSQCLVPIPGSMRGPSKKLLLLLWVWELLRGLQQSVNILTCQGPDGQQGHLQLSVAQLPINLAGRGLLERWGAKIHIPEGISYSTQSQNRMHKQGHIKGLRLR